MSELRVDEITNAAGTGAPDFTQDLKTDVISESTAAAGVTIDGVVLKDNGFSATAKSTVTLNTYPQLNVSNGVSRDWDIGVRGSGESNPGSFEIEDNSGATTRLRISTGGTFTLNGLGTGDVQATAGVLSVTSDETLKENIVNFDKGMAEIKLIQPITFNWKSETEMDSSINFSGFSAQDVQAAIPEAIHTNAETGKLGLDSRTIIAALVNAVKELETRIVALENA